MNNNMLILVSTIVAMACAEGNASTPALTNKVDGIIKIGDKLISREQLKDAIGRVKLNRTGGYVRQPGTAKGHFVLLNAQKSVSKSEFVDVLRVIDRQVKIQTKQIDLADVKVGTLRETIVKEKAEVGVAVVDDKELPALLVAPEEGWGLVNVNKLRNADSSKFAARVRREILRAFGLAAGAMYAAQGDFVLQPVRKPEDLDTIRREEFGVMMLRLYPLSLPYYGVAPWRQVTYMKACEEGWAPAPTNEYQKAIWDKVHAIPAAPMKIEFDPKKGR